MSYIRRGLQFLGYSYLLRVPATAWIVLMALWLGSLSFSPAEPILRGVFDVASPTSTVAATIAQFAATTLAALLAGTSIGVSARLVICNAHIRFRAAPVELTTGIELLFRLFPLVSTIALLSTALLSAEAPWAGKLPGVIIGAVGWYLVTIKASRWFANFNSDRIRRFRAGAWVPEGEPGYLDLASTTLQKRHLFATYQFLLALAAYIVYCILSFIDLAYLGGHFLAPTLSLAIMMIALFCWGLSGIAFFLDRYRIPLLLPVFVVASSSGFFQQSDYFYQGLPMNETFVSNSAQEIIKMHGEKLGADAPIVVVATTGGGIQAAGWTTRVLAGLTEKVSVGNGGAGGNFSRYVRVISAVSGGSVGAMYFTSAYRNGEVTPQTAKAIIAAADKSSLDEVTLGLSYPDFVFGLFPWLKGLGFSSGEVHFSDSGFIFLDRGRMLEDSWRRRIVPEEQEDATLGSWRRDVANGNRPAVIFNSTLVETGERYLLSTTDLTDSDANKARREQFNGRWEFSKLYPRSDLRVRTAARLSATFPYVTPAARMLRNDASSNEKEDGRFYSSEPHAVDGGYYDNYGIVSLFDWLDNGLNTTRPRPKVLIVEIRASATGRKGRPQSSSWGTIFQLTHPLLTLANVRNTGQLSHNALDEALMNRLYTPSLCEVVFEFKNTDSRGAPRNEPLNWHLTPSDIEGLRNAWENSDEIKENVARVQTFLSEGACLTK